MSDIQNLLWQIGELRKELSETKVKLQHTETEVTELKQTVQSLISDKLEAILERIMKAIELQTEMQANNILTSFYTAKPPNS